MGATKIFTFVTPVDAGPPPIERTFASLPIPLGWQHLSARCTYSGAGWAGSLQIQPIQQIFFNRNPQPPSPFETTLPNQSYVTSTGDFLFVTTVGSTGGLTCTIELFGDQLPIQTECQYGTEPKDGTVFTVLLTGAIIEAALAAVGMAWAGIIFNIFIGTTVQVGGLCASLPPPAPRLDESLFESSLQTKKQALDVILWNYFCQCKPGTPSPISPAPPFAPQPPGLVLPVPPSCLETDICAQVVAIRQDLFALSSAVAAIADVATVSQRFGTPMAWIPGPTHPNLIGEGSFSASRFLGVFVTVLSDVSTNKKVIGNPDYIYDLGWLSFLRDDDLVDEIRLTRTEQIWLPPRAPAANRFGWSLRENVVISVQELYAEP